MKRLGDKGFTGTRLTTKQDRGVRIDHSMNHFEHILHPARIADDIINAIFLGKFPLEFEVFSAQVIFFFIDDLYSPNGLRDNAGQHRQEL